MSAASRVARRQAKIAFPNIRAAQEDLYDSDDDEEEEEDDSHSIEKFNWPCIAPFIDDLIEFDGFVRGAFSLSR